LGTDRAYDVEIHVVAWQEGEVKAIDTTIAVGTLDGHGWQQVDANVTYTGDPLLSAVLTPQWT
jgi:hypothetical protein